MRPEITVTLLIVAVLLMAQSVRWVAEAIAADLDDYDREEP